jgi:GNAT superfamily N-acetyltransferase
MELRDATPADLGAVYQVWYATEIDGLSDPPPPRSMPWFAHLLGIGRLTVALEDNVVVGFAGAVDHGPCVALSDLFVHPAWQSQGVGNALLDAVLPPDRPRVTMASADPRAVASYARRGILPRWPAYYLAVTPDSLRADPRRGGRPGRCVEPLIPADYPWDLPGDAEHYGHLGARPLAVRVGRHRIGTALVLTGSPQRLSHPETTELLETTAGSVEDAAELVLAVVGHTLDHGASRVLVQAPGPHPVLPALLRLGFRIQDADMACASADGLLADPRWHTMHGEARIQRS